MCCPMHLLHQKVAWSFKCFFLGRTLTPLYFLGIETDVVKLHLIGFTHDQVVKHLLCNLIMCEPNSAVISNIALFKVERFWSTEIPSHVKILVFLQ